MDFLHLAAPRPPPLHMYIYTTTVLEHHHSSISRSRPRASVTTVNKSDCSKKNLSASQHFTKCNFWMKSTYGNLFIYVPDWQPRVLLGMVEARSVNVKKTTTTTQQGLEKINEVVRRLGCGVNYMYRVCLRDRGRSVECLGWKSEPIILTSS